MATYQKYNWPELFQAFEQSELSQTTFCKQRNINPKYFNVKLKQRQQVIDNPSSAFTRLQVASSEYSSHITNQVVIEHGQCKIHCPDSMTPSTMAALVRLLA